MVTVANSAVLGIWDLLLLLHRDTNAFACVDHSKLWKILKEMGIPDHLTCLLYAEICMQVKKKQLEPDMEQRTGSKMGKEYIMWNAGLDEPQAGIKIARRNISNLR